jgi:hypothetical protein
MDKTVRLWDTEAKACLKLFPHNDYGELALAVLASRRAPAMAMMMMSLI